MRFFNNKPLDEKILITLGMVLLSFYAIVYIRNIFSLDHAVVNNDVKRVKLLLKMGYTVNPTDAQASFPPLRMAVSNGNKEISEILISHGADIDIKDKYDYTLLDYAIIFKRNAVARLLIEKGIQLNEHNLYRAANCGDKEIVELLIKQGLNVNASIKDVLSVNRPCPCCPTPLIAAASNNHSDVAQLLLEHGANINGIGKYAIHLFMQQYHVERKNS